MKPKIIKPNSPPKAKGKSQTVGAQLKAIGVLLPRATRFVLIEHVRWAEAALLLAIAVIALYVMVTMYLLEPATSTAPAQVPQRELLSQELISFEQWQANRRREAARSLVVPSAAGFP